MRNPGDGGGEKRGSSRPSFRLLGHRISLQQRHVD